jgi:hypothetical protein
LTETAPGNSVPTAEGAMGGSLPAPGSAGAEGTIDLPLPTSEEFVLDMEVGFQLVNCSPVPLEVKTFNQYDVTRFLPNKTYRLEPNAAVNCTAMATGDPFDIQFTVSGQLARACQNTCVYAIQVG